MAATTSERERGVIAAFIARNKEGEKP